MGLSQATSGTYLPAALSTLDTLFTDSVLGEKQFGIDQSNLPAGTVLNLSIQVILTSGGTTYKETKNVTLSNPVAVPAAPAVGYEPLWWSPWYTNISGLQVQAQVVSGSLPTTGLPWVENEIS